MDPILINVPEEIRGERVVLVAPRPNTGTAVNEAVRESIDVLRPWMPWAKTMPSVDESEVYCRRAAARFLLRETLDYHLFLPDRRTFIGCCGVPRLNWTVPWFEIGYWLRTRFAGQGLMTDAVRQLTRMLVQHLKAARVEIRADERNARSWRVAERAGFVLEGTLHADSVDGDGRPRNTRVYRHPA